jgi:hypothetical protein
MPEITEEQLAAVASYAYKNPPPYCELCAKPAAGGLIGLWVVNEKAAHILDLPAHRSPVVIYGLCPQCGAEPDAPERAEKKRFERVLRGHSETLIDMDDLEPMQ